ncbi:hypothetical protein AVEN_11979-1, partial [Araneus ventricosus]
MEWLPK